jgi:hypothetical protein
MAKMRITSENLIAFDEQIETEIVQILPASTTMSLSRSIEV